MPMSTLANSALVPSAGDSLSWQKDGCSATSNESRIKVATPFKLNFVQACWLSLSWWRQSLDSCGIRKPAWFWIKPAMKWALSDSKPPHQAPQMFCSPSTENCLVSDLRSALQSWSSINNTQTTPCRCLSNPFLKPLVTDIPQPPWTMCSHVMTKFLLPFIKWSILEQRRSALGKLTWNNSQTGISSIV